MKVNITISYSIKGDYYKLDVKDSEDKVIPFVNTRVYEKEYEAEIAAGIMKLMFDKIEYRADFDINLFDFNIRAVFRLLNSPGKW